MGARDQRSVSTVKTRAREWLLLGRSRRLDTGCRSLVIYTLLTKGAQYVDRGQDYYEERYRQRVVHHLNR